MSCICPNERAREDDRQALRCFANYYDELCARRGIVVPLETIERIARANRIRDIRLGELEFRNVTHEITECLILRQAIRQFAKAHPAFQAQPPNLNFDVKIDRFDSL